MRRVAGGVRRRLVAGLACLVALPAAAGAAGLTTADRVLLSEGFRLAAELGETIWPGWSVAPFEVLLVGEAHEYLVGSERRPEGFTPLGEDELLGGMVLTRERTVPPALRAAYPLFGGAPVVVIGRPEATGLDPVAWLAVLLHEHFHQLQMSDPGYYGEVAELDLEKHGAGGMWMLEFPFPYDDPAVGELYAGFCRALLAARDGRAPAAEVRPALAALERALPAEAGRYLAFQLWQEGVARYVELRTARLAAERFLPSPALRSFTDFRPFAEVVEELERRVRESLAEPRLAEQRRVAFYAAGAALAELLDETAPPWRERYLSHKFALGEALP